MNSGKLLQVKSSLRFNKKYENSAKLNRSRALYWADFCYKLPIFRF